MPNYLPPGVYVEEIPSVPRRVEGVSTSTTAFVGATYRGPVNSPTRISTWDEYVAQFGDLSHPSGIASENDKTGLAVRAFYQNGGGAAYICRMPGGNSTDTGMTLNNADADHYDSFYRSILRNVRDVSIIVLPSQIWPADGSGNEIITNTINHCEATRSCVVIVDIENIEFNGVDDVNRMSLPTSSYSVLFYPWIIISNPLFDANTNPLASRIIQLAPSAIAAGIFTKTDVRHGVWKAPAGMEARINVAGITFDVDDSKQDFLNPLAVNCIRRMPAYGPVIWGSRTLATQTNPEWRYVSVRRTAIYIEQSIYHGIQWAVFESNESPLWTSLRANIESFMNGLFRAGAMKGQTPDEAYFVRCALGDTMTLDDVDRGQVVIVVGFAPLKPAEFVILRLQQKVGQ